MLLKTLHKITLVVAGLAGVFSTSAAHAQEHWYGDVRHVMVTPLRMQGEMRAEVANRVEAIVTMALREHLPGITVTPRTEMQGMWDEVAARTNGRCDTPACWQEMARNNGCDTVVAASLNMMDPRGLLTLRWMNVDNGTVVRTQDEMIGHDESRFEVGVRHAVSMLVAETGAPMVDSYMPQPQPMMQPPQPQYQQPQYQPQQYQPQPYQPPPPACSNGYQCETIGDYADAQQYYMMECQNGMPMSCNAMGVMYESAMGIPFDGFRAHQMYERACELNLADGCAHLGMMFEAGRGGPQDVLRARMLYDRSCSMGAANGCYLVAVMWERGIGGPGEPERAREFYRRACDNGEGRGCSGLATMHEAGRGGPANRDEAMRMFGLGCDHGDADACRRLGRPVPPQPMMNRPQPMMNRPQPVMNQPQPIMNRPMPQPQPMPVQQQPRPVAQELRPMPQPMPVQQPRPVEVRPAEPRPMPQQPRPEAPRPEHPEHPAHPARPR